jgi:HlyD family secretion protein
MSQQRMYLGVAVLVIALGGAGVWFYQQEHQPSLTLYGNVDIRTVNLSFRVAGRLSDVRVDEGDSVQAGDVVGLLDDAPYQTALQQAKASVAVAQAKLDLMHDGYRNEETAQVKAQVAQLKSALDYADSFYRRQQSVVKSGGVSMNQLEDARTLRNQAQANLQAAQDKLRQYRTGNRPQEIKQAAAALEEARAQYAQAALNVSDTRLITPSAGTILTRAVEPGTMLSAGSSVLTLSLTQPVWVRAYISEVNLQNAVPGRSVLIYTDGRPDRPYHGSIGFVSPSAEFTPKSVETTDLRTDLVYRIRIVVQDADASLRQGMPVSLKFADKTP